MKQPGPSFKDLLQQQQYSSLDDLTAKALAANPDDIHALYFRAESQKMQMRYAPALAAGLKVLRLKPEHMPVKSLVVQCAGQLGLVDLACEWIESFELAHHSTQKSWAPVFYRDLGLYDKALDSIEAVIKQFPDDPYPVQIKGTIEMCMGRYDQGIRDYQQYVSVDFFTRHRPDIHDAGWDLSRYWCGERLDGKTILVVPHGGVGDMIQFVRYTDGLRELGAKRVIVYLPTTRIAKLLGSFPGIEVGVDLKPDQYDVFTDPYGLWLHLFPKFGYLSTDRYLRAPDSPFSSEMVQFIKERARGKRLLGLSWCSDMADGAPRTVPLAQLMPLFALPDVHWVIFQRGWALKEFEQLPVAAQCTVVPELASFDDTAAITQQLECVVTIESFMTHLAGATGTPVLLMGGKALDWRHGNAEGTSPWYPHTTIVRQPEMGDWRSVVRQLVDLLQKGSTQANASLPLPAPAANVPEPLGSQSAYMLVKPNRTLYIDCSGFETDRGSDESLEVISQLISQWSGMASDAMSIELVSNLQAGLPYRLDQPLCARLRRAGNESAGAFVSPEAGDIFLITSADPRTTIERQGYYHALQTQGVKVLTLVHDLSPLFLADKYPSQLVSEFHIYVRLLFDLHGVLCFSQKNAQEFASLAHLNQIELPQSYVIAWANTGVCIPQTPAISPKYEAPTFVTVATNGHLSGLDGLLAAFDALWAQGVAPRLRIIGSGRWADTPEARSIREHPQFGRSLLLTQSTGRPNLANLHLMGDCYIDNNQDGGYNLAASQALYSGMPMLLPDVPIYRNTTFNNATLFEPGQLNSLEKCIESFPMRSLALERALQTPGPTPNWEACAGYFWHRFLRA